MRIEAVFLCLCAGCFGGDDIDTVFDPCSSLTVAPAEGTEASEVASIEAAIEAWGRVLPVQAAVEVGSTDPAALRVVFESGDLFYRATYWDQLGEISLSREHLDPGDYALAVAHEMGHAFGLHHVAPDQRESVMNVGNLEVPPSPADAAAVGELWDSCTRSSGLR